MIVCSYYTYLNAVTQLLSKQDLLKANYLIIDLPGPSGAFIGDHDKIESAMASNVDGFDYEKNRFIGQKKKVEDNVIIKPSRYSVHYGLLQFDMQPYLNTIMQGHFEADVESYMRWMNQPSSLYKVLNLLKEFTKRDGVDILLFQSDRYIYYFGDAICSYISKNFGIDIKCLEPMFRPSIRCSTEYVGDKDYAKKLERELIDYGIIQMVEKYTSGADKYDAEQNLRTSFRDYSWDALIHVYELLFPVDPLPPGQYSDDELKDIIIGKSTDGLRSRDPALLNLYENNAEFQAYLDSFQHDNGYLGTYAE